MIKKIKVILIVMAVISVGILTIIFMQDRTRKLEDREYKEIETITINSDYANINIYKSENENTKVVVFGTTKDIVEIVEGSKSLTISKITGDNKCILNCKNIIDIYVPESVFKLDIKSDKGNISSETLIKNIKISSEYGNISLSKINKIYSISKYGNVVIDEIDATDNSYIKTEVGNVSISKIINIKLDTKSESGSVVIPLIRDEHEFTLKIESDKGNVDIEHYENKSE